MPLTRALPPLGASNIDSANGVFSENVRGWSPADIYVNRSFISAARGARPPIPIPVPIPRSGHIC